MDSSLPLPFGIDWTVFLPAVREFIQGGNPYLIGEGFGRVYEPFWTYIFLSPFAFFSSYWSGRTLLFAVSLICFALSAIKMGATRTQTIFFLLSAPVLGCLNNGQIDWLITMGFWMPPQIGLFFVLMKPQVGFGAALFWLYTSYQTGGIREVIRIFAPISLAYLLSFGLYGFWFRGYIGMETNPENMSAFPWAFLPGLALLFFSLRDRQKDLAVFSSPLLSPYVSQFSYSTLLLALFKRPVLFYITWVALWLTIIARFMIEY